ncbi:sugar ABC transporter substrate-binding protein [Amphibacillus sp. Q70]|uniref:sugar ABC transporter substrate-binding protein n=1 Tax=Amphibacillus sp. Q70 TaxID=3453416 RepID=UPI003F859F2D
MTFKKWLSLWFVAIIIILMGCGSHTDESNANTDSSDQEGESQHELSDEDEGSQEKKPEKLTMWVHDEEVQLDAYFEITDKFTEEYGIDIEIIPYSQGDQLEGMALDGPGGIGPDLFYTAHDHLGNIFNQGLAAELEFTDEQLLQLEEYDSDVLHSFSYEGTQYGIPAVVETYLLFYNKSLIDESPATIDEMMTISGELRDGDQYGFVIDAANFYFVYPFLTAPGGFVFEQIDAGEFDVESIGLNTEGAIKGGELIQSWYEDDLIPIGMDFDIMSGLFSDGKAAMAIDGPWAIADYENSLGDDLGISTLPAWEDNPIKSFSGNKGWIVNYYSENIYWATELALFITNSENGTLYYEIANELPANTHAIVEDEKMEPVLEQMQFAEPMPNVPEMAQVWEPMADALQFIAQGEDPESVLNEAVEIIFQQIELSKQ